MIASPSIRTPESSGPARPAIQPSIHLPNHPITRSKESSMSLLTRPFRPLDPFALPAAELPMGRLGSFLDRALERLAGEPLGLGEAVAARAEARWFPPLDVSETDEEITLRAELPGIAPKDVELSVNGSTLTISGKKEAVEEREGEDWWRCERRFGAFRRMLDLPASADPDRIVAEAEHGIVTVRIGKKPAAKSRSVEVRSSVTEPKPAPRKVAVHA